MNHISFPLVSVGLPTFNRASSLTKAIESVLRQTYPNIELIISDNASTDDTQLICKNFSNSDQRVTYIRQKSNLGASNNFSEVLRYSTGEYFMWLGDDDWIDYSYISECIKELTEHPDYSLVVGKVLYYVNKNFAYEDIILNLIQEGECERVLSYYSQVGENGAFYGLMRRSQISKISMHNIMGGDWLVIASLAFLGKVKTIPHICVHRESNWSINYHKKLAKRLGLSNFQGNNPYISIAFSACNEIIMNIQIYENLNLLQRIILSKNILVLLIKERQFPIYKSNILEFIYSSIPKWAYPQLRSLYRKFSERV